MVDGTLPSACPMTVGRRPRLARSAIWMPPGEEPGRDRAGGKRFERWHELDRAIVLTLQRGRNRLRLGRDYYVRIDTNDYSIDPHVIGRIVDVAEEGKPFVGSVVGLVECLQPSAPTSRKSMGCPPSLLGPRATVLDATAPVWRRWRSRR